jgi:hypothetical protein
MNSFISIFKKKLNFKKFIILYFILTTSVFLVYPYFVYRLYSHPSHGLAWIQNSYRKKEAIAKSIKGKKIVFVSGSNTLFGVRTQDIQSAIGIPVVNLGVDIALGPDYILERSKRSLRSGDTVILPLEYKFYMFDGDREQTEIDYVLTLDKPFLQKLSFLDRVRFLDSVEPMEIFLSLGRRKLPPETPVGNGFSSKTLNSNGDETDNFDQKIILDNIKKKYKPVPIQRIQPYYESFGLREVIKYKEWCDKNNVNMVITWPATIYFGVYKDLSYREYFSFLISFFKAHHISVLGSPYDFFYPINYFYNSIYHLNSMGMTIRTNKLIDLLRRADVGK